MRGGIAVEMVSTRLIRFDGGGESLRVVSTSVAKRCNQPASQLGDGRNALRTIPSDVNAGALFGLCHNEQSARTREDENMHNDALAKRTPFGRMRRETTKLDAQSRGDAV